MNITGLDKKKQMDFAHIEALVLNNFHRMRKISEPQILFLLGKFIQSQIGYAYDTFGQGTPETLDRRDYDIWVGGYVCGLKDAFHEVYLSVYEPTFDITGINDIPYFIRDAVKMEVNEYEIR